MGDDGQAAEAYDRLAPAYDEFNADNSYEQWLGEVLLPEMEKRGLRQTGGRVLDIGCGTGRAFPPFLKRGWRISGCDVSSEMLSLARDKYGDRAGVESLWQDDIRSLQKAAVPFDLVLALNDVVNYLTEDGDLERAFAAMQANRAADGLVCFDANSLDLYESDWLAGSSGEMSQRGWVWTGLTEDAAPGQVFEAEIRGQDTEPSLHRQRHWPRPSIEAALESVGLSCLVVLGQREEEGRILLEDPPEESRHYKTIYIAGTA